MEDYNLILQMIRYCITKDLMCNEYKINDEQNTITFTYKDVSFVCFYEKDDPYYIRILIPEIDTICDHTTVEIYKYILELNARFKTGKFILIDNALWISAEVMLSGNTRIPPVLFTLVNLLIHMRDEYALFIKDKVLAENNTK